MTTATRYPTTTSPISGVWNNQSNLFAADSNVCDISRGTTKNSEDDLFCGDFGFQSEIPSGSTINRVDIEVSHRVQTTANICFLENYLTTEGGDSSVNSDSTEPTTLTPTVYSDIPRPAGGAWQWSDFDDTFFSVILRARNGNNNGANVWEWDYVRVVVDYTAAVAPSGDGDLTLQALEVSAQGIEEEVGSGAVTLQAAQISADAALIQPTAQGALSLENPQLSASGLEELIATASLVLEVTLISASGSLPSAGRTMVVIDAQGTSGLVTGTGVVLLEQATVLAEGIMQPSGAGALSLSQITVSATALETLIGQGALSLDQIQLAGQALEEFLATGVIDLDLLTLSAQGLMQPEATAVLELEIPTILAQAEQVQEGPPSGTGVLTLAQIDLAGVGLLEIDGAGVLTLDQTEISSQGIETLIGSGSLVLSEPTVSASSFEQLLATASPILLPTEISGVGDLPTAGIGALDLTDVSINAQGTATTPPAGDGNLTLSIVSLSATSDIQPHGRIFVQISGQAIIGPFGEAALTLFAPTLSAQGITIGGTSALTLEALQISEGIGFYQETVVAQFVLIDAQGEAKTSADAAIVLPKTRIRNTTGDEDFPGAGALELRDITLSSVGVLEYVGVGSPILTPVQLSSTGIETIIGDGSIVLIPSEILAIGAPQIPGDAVVLLTDIEVLGLGEGLSPTATGSLILLPPILDAQGILAYTGDGSLTLDALTIDGIGGLFPTGEADIILQQVVLFARQYQKRASRGFLVNVGRLLRAS